MNRLRAAHYLALNNYELGLNVLWNGMHIIILPAVLLQVVPDARKGTYLGTMPFVGLIVAVLVQPVSGVLSDRTRIAWGRPRLCCDHN